MSPLTTCSGRFGPAQRRGRLGVRGRRRSPPALRPIPAGMPHSCAHLWNRAPSSERCVQHPGEQSARRHRQTWAEVVAAPLGAPLSSVRPATRAPDEKHRLPAPSADTTAHHCIGLGSSSRLERPLWRGSEAGLEDGREDPRATLVDGPSGPVPAAHPPRPAASLEGVN